MQHWNEIYTKKVSSKVDAGCYCGDVNSEMGEDNPDIFGFDKLNLV